MAESCFDVNGAFIVFTVTIRRRNRLMKQQEKEAFEQSRRAAGQEGGKQDGSA